MRVTDETARNEEWFCEEVATLGDRLAAAREAMELSRGELAARLGVQETTIAAWEDDRSEPRANRLQMVSGMVKVSVGWLLTGRGQGLACPEGAAGEGIGPATVATLADLHALRGDLARLDTRIASAQERLRALLGSAAA